MLNNTLQTGKLGTPQGLSNVGAINTGNTKNTNLTITSNIINECQPITQCQNIGPDKAIVGVYTFAFNNYHRMAQFPGSAYGWTVTFSFAGDVTPTQYDVNQTFSSLNDASIYSKNNYSKGCHGTIQNGDNIACVINSTLSSNPQNHLKIVTVVKNLCHDKARCSYILPDDFNLRVYELQGYAPILNYFQIGNAFPGSASGWTVTTPPEVIQYKVKQSPDVPSPLLIVPGQNGTLAGVTYNGCEGILRNGWT
ncbi:MAG TPA: hypothetical protein VH500_02225 [Nitrososphaeraceae archaeon]